MIKELFRSMIEHILGRVLNLSSKAPPQLQGPISYHLSTIQETKGFRLGLLIALSQKYEGLGDRLSYLELIRKGTILQLLHEASLLIDDVADRGRVRRGKPTTRLRYGAMLSMTSGAWLVSKAIDQALNFDEVKALNSCLREITEAEALQWSKRLSSRPISLDLWKEIAWGDTGAFFRLAEKFAGGDGSDIEVAQLILLYHGLDDLGDLLDEGTFKGGKVADLRDKIPTLLEVMVGSERQKVWGSLNYLWVFLENIHLISQELRPFFYFLRGEWERLNSIAIARGEIK